MNEHKKRVGCFGWGVRTLVGCIALTAILMAVGYFYMTKTIKDDFKRYLIPGQLVDVGDHKLHIYCTGEGGPTVVVDAGNGDFSLGWGHVQPEVAEFTRICTYDRAGYGWSEFGPEPRTARRIGTELHTLLVEAGEEGPYILVGQSLGGFTARMVYAMYPEEVAGMVLVDSGHEDQLERFPQEYADLSAQQGATLHLVRLLSRFGLVRFLESTTVGQGMMPAYVFDLPERDREAYIALISHPAYFEAALAETDVFPESAAQVASLAHLGNLPLMVLTAENSLDLAVQESLGLSTSIDADQIVQVWSDLQSELASLSTDGTHIIAEGSGHMIHVDRPDLVIEAIRQVVTGELE